MVSFDSDGVAVRMRPLIYGGEAPPIEQKKITITHLIIRITLQNAYCRREII